DVFLPVMVHRFTVWYIIKSQRENQILVQAVRLFKMNTDIFYLVYTNHILRPVKQPLQNGLFLLVDPVHSFDNQFPPVVTFSVEFPNHAYIVDNFRECGIVCRCFTSKVPIGWLCSN